MSEEYDVNYEVPSKIPKDAERVFKGVVWDVYHWQQKMFDGSYGTFEGLRQRNGVKIIAANGKKIFMSREETPADAMRYTLLGGGIKDGETPLDAAKRELLEESGLVSNDWTLLQVIDLLKYRRIDHYVYLFLAKGCIKTAGQKLDAGEKITVEEVDFDQFVDKLKNSKEHLGREVDEMLNNPEWVKSFRQQIEM